MSNATMTTEPKLKGPHARRRFIAQLNKVQALLHEARGLANDSLPGQVLFKGNARGPFFMLQGLARVYRKLDPEEKLFDRIKLETKIMEDVLGLTDFWAATARKCEEWKLPEGVRKLAHERYIEACGRVWTWAEARHWNANRYEEMEELLAMKLARKLKDVEWLSPRKESKDLRKWLVDEIESIEEQIQQLNFQEIEAGLHEARREIRWISIYFSAMEGAFVLDTEATPPSNWERYLTPAIVNNPFNKLTEPETEDVLIVIPAYLLYALSYIIEKLGVIKDRAQWTETVQHLLHLTGEKADLPTLMGENYLEPAEATRQGMAVMEQVLVKDRLLERLREAFQIAK